MINCSVLTPHVKELGKKLNIENETLLRGLFTAWKSNNPDKLDNEITEADLKELLKENSQIKGENISSKGSAFARKLTNIGNNLTVEYKGIVFRNAEHAYQTWKSGEFDEAAYKSTAFKPVGTKKVNTSTNYQTMVEILTAKLQQHPELIEGINQRGGLAYLASSTHTVIGDKYWESAGQNKFIEALIDAYNTVTASHLDVKTASNPDAIVTPIKPQQTQSSTEYTTNLDIISVNVSTPRAKLNASIDPNLIPERAKLIADTFYDICDAALEEKKDELRKKGDYMTIMEWESSVYGRAKGIKTIPVKELLRRLQNHFREAASINEEWQKIWDNFIPLLEDA